ncbi:hypothetical protein ACS0TY_006734 [Phlomoides rotata]
MFRETLIVGSGAVMFLASSLPVWPMTFFVLPIPGLTGLLGSGALLYPHAVLPSSRGLFRISSPLLIGFAVLGCMVPLFAFSVTLPRSPWIIYLLITPSLEIFLVRLPQFISGSSCCLWRVAFITTLWFIWHAHNKAVFDEVRPSLHHSLAFILAAIKEADHSVWGHMPGMVRELLILDRLGIRGRPPSVQTTTVIRWKPPLAGWTKVNVDGSAPSSPGSLFAGASSSLPSPERLGWGYPLEAELTSILHAILFTFDRGWHSLWVESDSILAIQTLQRSIQLVPWRLHGLSSKT